MRTCDGGGGGGRSGRQSRPSWSASARLQPPGWVTSIREGRAGGVWAAGASSRKPTGRIRLSNGGITGPRPRAGTWTDAGRRSSQGAGAAKTPWEAARCS